MPVVFKITNLKLFGQKFLDTLKILYLSSGGHEKVDPIIPKQQVKAILLLFNNRTWLQLTLFL